MKPTRRCCSAIALRPHAPVTLPFPVPCLILEYAASGFAERRGHVAKALEPDVARAGDGSFCTQGIVRDGELPEPSRAFEGIERNGRAPCLGAKKPDRVYAGYRNCLRSLVVALRVKAADSRFEGSSDFTIGGVSSTAWAISEIARSVACMPKRRSVRLTTPRPVPRPPRARTKHVG